MNAGDDYTDELREDISRCIAELEPGEWGELAICPGPYGCLAEYEFPDDPARAEAEGCSACRLIRFYRPK